MSKQIKAAIIGSGNIDEFTETTARGIETVGGAAKGKGGRGIRR